MPELPEVEALALDLKGRLTGRAIAKVHVVAISALKTFDPPVQALEGTLVDDVARHGKFLDIQTSGLHLNAAFPRVSGDLVQVSPLIDRIPWKQEPPDRSFKIIYIPDRLFAIRDEQANGVFRGTIYLRDQQPVVRGARYRYFLVRFLPNGEVDQIIQAGEVEASYVFGAACIDC
jgi:hypothetical protein